MAQERLRISSPPIKQLKIGIKIADCVDSGATGTYTSTNKKLPAGAYVLGIKAVGGDWSGDTTASLLVGKTGATDDFSGAAITGYAAAGPITSYGHPATEGEQFLIAETPVVVTITGAGDFTNIVNANNPLAQMYVTVFYIDLNAKAI